MSLTFQASAADPDWGPYLKQHRGERYKNMEEPREALEIALDRALDENNSGANPGYEDDEGYVKIGQDVEKVEHVKEGELRRNSKPDEKDAIETKL